MKKKLLKLADSLLSKEEMKSLKGGDYPPTGGGGSGSSHNAYCYSSYAGNGFYIPVVSCNYWDMQGAYDACNNAAGGGFGIVSCS